ncbi:hypothetical protein HZA39_02140 [Candidatus Peregrinibacteria bacterium]|nr:hypothetical protein [Candidatus Peregrinibacteria bacterium]
MKMKNTVAPNPLTDTLLGSDLMMDPLQYAVCKKMNGSICDNICPEKDVVEGILHAYRISHSDKFVIKNFIINTIARLFGAFDGNKISLFLGPKEVLIERFKKKGVEPVIIKEIIGTRKQIYNTILNLPDDALKSPANV